MSQSKKALITGIAGQDGAYLSNLLLQKGYDVYGMDRQDIVMKFERLEHFGILDQIQLCSFDLLDYKDIYDNLERIKPDEIYNLAAQSSVGASFADPVLAAESCGMSTLKILEAIRQLDVGIRFYQASSSEMFGKVQTHLQNENSPFHPRSPYACAKVFAHNSTINYREAYNLFACSGILFNHESPLRSPNFVTRKITQSLTKIKFGLQEKLLLGNMNAKRDWGYAEEYVEAMWLMLQQDEPDDFVIATGETHTIREFVEITSKILGMNIEWSGIGVDETGVDINTGKTVIEISPEFFRPAEVDNTVGDASKAQKELGWKPSVNFEEMIRIMVEADILEIENQPTT